MSDVPCPPAFLPGTAVSTSEAKKYLKRCGICVKIFAGCRIFPPGLVVVGDYSQIDEGVFIFAGEGVTLGNHVHMAFASSISGGGTCTIHDFVGIGAGVRLITGTEEIHGDGLTNPTIPPEIRAVRRGTVEIGPHALVFTNAVVLPGVHIGEGAVVAAGSLVHHDLKAWGVYAGNPLTRVGTRSRETVLKRQQELARHEGNPNSNIACT